MADFTHPLLGWLIALATLGGILACGWLIYACRKVRVHARDHHAPDTPHPVETTGHVWDENLTELNHPLPRWWMWLFILTLGFGVMYLAIYPGLGSYAGTTQWSAAGEYAAEVRQQDAITAPLFAAYRSQSVEQLAANPQARASGEKLFLNHCAACHGSDARGSKGFPNLADNDWLYGGDSNTIHTTLMGGRQGMMPPMGAAVGGEAGIRQVAHYVLSLSGSPHDAAEARAGQPRFAVCAGCHGAQGQGNQALGAPNLSDRVWLFGGSLGSIMETIRTGRSNRMPAFGDALGADKVHLLSAYVWSLSRTPGATVTP